MSETSLFFGLASHRLRARCRWAGVALLFAPLVPYQVIDNKPQFLWQIARELPIAGIVAAIAPMLAGVVILVASSSARRSTSLAAAVLAALAAATALFHFGADASAWGALPLPEGLIEHPTSALLGLGLTAAGANLAWKPHCRPFARRALFAAAALTALAYILPTSGGQAPIVSAWRLVGALITTPYIRAKIGFFFLAFGVLAPALIAGFGVRLAFRAPDREKPVLGALAIYGLPAIMLALLYRSFFGADLGAEILSAIGAAFVLAAVLALLASAFEVLGEAAVTAEEELEQPPGLPLGRAALVASAAFLVVSGAQAAIARPPTKGVEWPLRAATPEGDRLFDDRVSAWSGARGTPDEFTAASTMLDDARSLDATLGAALSTLTEETRDPDVSARRLYGLVDAANEASRAAGLPYYLDPNVQIGQSGDGIERRFRLLSYRINEVHGFSVDGRPYATLHVRSIGERRNGHQPLGFSRDMQRFALVVLDEIEPFARSLARGANATWPTCGKSNDPAAQRGFDRCGEALVALTASLVPSASPAPAPTESATGDAAPSDHDADEPATTDAQAKLELALLPVAIATTERHELQHQIDGPHLPMSEAVRRRLPPPYDARSRDAVNRELSAYVAELSGRDASPKLGLIHLMRFALSSRGTIEHHVARIALAALSGRDPKPAREAAEIEAAITDFDALMMLDENALRKRAAEAWSDLFGSDLPIADRSP